jgi:Na+-driven multidrug efflux pump
MPYRRNPDGTYTRWTYSRNANGTYNRVYEGQNKSAEQWGRLWGTLAAMAAVLAFLAWPGWISLMAWPHDMTRFWIADGIWWGILVVLALAGGIGWYRQKREWERGERMRANRNIGL